MTKTQRIAAEQKKREDRLCACNHRAGNHVRDSSGPLARLACKECGCKQFRPGE